MRKVKITIIHRTITYSTKYEIIGSYNFHIPARVPPVVDDFFSTAVLLETALLDIPPVVGVAVSLFALIISVHLTASCNSMNFSLY